MRWNRQLDECRYVGRGGKQVEAPLVRTVAAKPVERHGAVSYGRCHEPDRKGCLIGCRHAYGFVAFVCGNRDATAGCLCLFLFFRCAAALGGSGRFSVVFVDRKVLSEAYVPLYQQNKEE